VKKASATTPQAKKSKTSSSAIAVSQLPPNPFEMANEIVHEAWKDAFPSLRFPVELIGVFPATK
jgi:hypothetical protein